jgi:uncharacterized membrane protein YjgN (DUF898 family)
MESQSQFETFELQLNSTALQFLKETAKWSYFLSILGFIGIGLMLVAAVFMATILGSMPTTGMGAFGAMQGMMSGIYVVMALLYFFPVYYLYKFASKMKSALSSKSTEELTDSIENLKSHYKFMGILAVIIISIYILILVGALIAGIAS